jgi:hypothetical protein
MTTTLEPTVSAAQSDALLQVFRDAPTPLTLTAAKRLYKGPKVKTNEWPALVQEQVLQGKLFECSPTGKTPRYWHQDEERKVVETIEELLAADRLAESKLVTAVNKTLGKVTSAPAIKKLIATMKEQKRLHIVPGKGKTSHLSLRPLSPLDTLKIKPGTWKDLATGFVSVEKQGISLEDFLQLVRKKLMSAPRVEVPPSSFTPPPLPREELPDEPLSPQVEIEDLILKGMRDLEPSVESGVPVSLRRLRAQMPTEYQTPEVFDRAVLQLAEDRRVIVHRHDHAAVLSEPEREGLVRDDYGNFYTVIAHRI